MSLDIRVNGISLKLFPDEEKNFYITKQLHDIRNLETRNASFTKQITVPNAGINSSILRQYLPLFASENSNPITYTSVDVLIDDVPIINDALLFSSDYLPNSKDITITILVDDQGFFNQLSDDPIADLFNELITWDLPTLNANVNNSTFWVYPDLIWSTNKSYELFNSLNTTGSDQLLGTQDIELSGIVVYLQEIWDRIMGNLVDLSADESWKTTFFNSMGLVAPVYEYLESYNIPSGALSAVELPANTPSNEDDLPLEFLTVVTDDDGLWDAVNFEFVIVNAGSAKVVLDLFIDCAPQGNNDKKTNHVYLKKNGIILQEWEIDYDENNHVISQVSYSEVSNLQVGDTLQVQVTTASINDGSAFKFFYSAGDKFQVLFGKSITEIPISQIIPNITQKNFVKSVMQLFHLIPRTVKRDLTFTYWEDIPKTSANLLSKRIAANKKILLANRIRTYGQTNHFEYADNDNVQRTDMNSSVPSLVETLPDDKTLIKLIYSACDDSLIETLQDGINFRASIPSFNFTYKEYIETIAFINGSVQYSSQAGSDFEPGDVVAVDDAGTWRRVRIETVTDDTSGTIKYPWIGTSLGYPLRLFKYSEQTVKNHLVLMSDSTDFMQIGNSGETPLTNTLNKKASFDQSLFWISLINNYYAVFVDSIEKPFVVQLWVKLEITEFIRFSSLTPIWLEEFADYFYLNKIEQFKNGELTRIELFRIKT